MVVWVGALEVWEITGFYIGFYIGFHDFEHFFLSLLPSATDHHRSRFLPGETPLRRRCGRHGADEQSLPGPWKRHQKRAGLNRIWMDLYGFCVGNGFSEVAVTFLVKSMGQSFL